MKQKWTDKKILTVMLNKLTAQLNQGKEILEFDRRYLQRYPYSIGMKLSIESMEQIQMEITKQIESISDSLRTIEKYYKSGDIK